MLFVRRRFEGTSELFEAVAGDNDMIKDSTAITEQTPVSVGGHVLFRQC